MVSTVSHVSRKIRDIKIIFQRKKNKKTTMPKQCNSSTHTHSPLEGASTCQYLVESRMKNLRLPQTKNGMRQIMNPSVFLRLDLPLFERRQSIMFRDFPASLTIHHAHPHTYLVVKWNSSHQALRSPLKEPHWTVLLLHIKHLHSSLCDLGHLTSLGIPLLFCEIRVLGYPYWEPC